MLQQTKTNKNDLDIFQPQMQHFKFKNEKNLFFVAGIKRHKRVGKTIKVNNIIS
jgi:hypothetical protein